MHEFAFQVLAQVTTCCNDQLINQEKYLVSSANFYKILGGITPQQRRSFFMPHNFILDLFCFLAIPYYWVITSDCGISCSASTPCVHRTNLGKKALELKTVKWFLLLLCLCYQSWGNAFVQSVLPCTVRTSRQSLCNQRIGCLTFAI